MTALHCRTILLAALVLGSSPFVHADGYAPPGLYEVRYLTLDNGLDVVLKRRTHAHNAAVRLVVDVGHRHFPCHKRETAHFLEHLLFTGTSKHSEAELDRLIEDHGGSWNAATDESRTEYQIDIFDRHLALAIDTLYEIITDTTITPEKVKLTREIIHQELGGKASRLRRWLYERGVGKSAAMKSQRALLPGTGVVCPGLDTPEGIDEADIKHAYQTHYVPNNMALIVVGSLEEDHVLSHIRRTFGHMGRGAIDRQPPATPPYPSESTEVTGTLSPLLGAGGNIAIAYRTDGLYSPDFYVLWVLRVYLDRVLYEKIRVAEGLSYSPEALYFFDMDYGIFIAGADAELDRLDKVRIMLKAELEKLRHGPLNAADIETTKQRILLARVQGYESNAEVANYYVSNVHELRTHGNLLDLETEIANVQATDIQRVVRKYLRKELQVTIRSTPTLTYTQFYVALGIIVVALFVVGGYFYRRVVRQYQRASTSRKI
ncbi:MAG: M16 family metallopeptidase [Acidiferrobacterales bacterium]